MCIRDRLDGCFATWVYSLEGFSSCWAIADYVTRHGCNKFGHELPVELLEPGTTCWASFYLLSQGILGVVMNYLLSYVVGYYLLS